MKLNNRVYNFLKYFITIFLPGVGASYFAAAEVWNFDNSQGVNGTINGFITVVGVLIGLSTHRYNKIAHAANDEPYDGDLVIGTVDGEKYVGLAVNTSIEAMQAKEEVRLQVVERSIPVSEE